VNREWIALHLEEAQEELERTLRELRRPDYSEVEFEVAMAHAYNHLNTAWNSRRATPSGWSGRAGSGSTSGARSPRTSTWGRPDGSYRLRSNVALQLTSAICCGVIVVEWLDSAQTCRLVIRLVSRSLAAELGR
jgi:hypothetical protein